MSEKRYNISCIWHVIGLDNSGGRSASEFGTRVEYRVYGRLQAEGQEGVDAGGK